MSYLELKVMGDVIAIEPCKELARDASKLWELHWQELGMADYELKLDVNLDYYTALEEEGMGFVASYRRNNELIGYCHAQIMSHPYHKDDTFATSNLIYIKKGFRNGTIAPKLLRWVEDECRRRGAVGFNIASNLNKGIGMWLMRKGYVPMDVVYTKRLGD